MKKISCGILLLNLRHELLLGKSTPAPCNQFHDMLDIPKGGQEVNEPLMETALRELKEEFNIDVPEKLKKNIVDLGLHHYNNKKNLHLFLLHDKDNEINYSEMKCNAFFVDDIDKQTYPEISNIAWYGIKPFFQEINEKKAKIAMSMYRVMNKSLQDTILKHLK